MAVELAYAIVENFYLLAVVLAIFWVWYLVIFRFLIKGNALDRYEHLTSSFILLFIFKSYPIDIFSPEHLVGGSTNLLNILIRLFFCGLVVVLLNSWFSGFSKGIISLLRVPYFAPLLFWGIVSFSWSETPVISFRSFLVVVGIACLASHFARKNTWGQIESILRWTILFCSIVSFASAVIAFPLPGSVGLSDVNLEGSLSNKELATLVSLGSILWILRALDNKNQRWISVTLGISSILLIFYLNSVTNIITAAVLVYISLLLYFLKRVNAKQSPVAIWIALTIGIVSALILQIYSTDIFALFGKSPNLTGRTSLIWPPVIDEILRNPLTGYGYVGYWQSWRGDNDPSLGLDSPLRIATEYSDGALSHAHNGLLELGLQLGIPGLIFFSLSMVSGLLASMKHFFRHKSLQIAAFPIILIVHMNLACLTETPRLGFVGPNYIWFLFVMTQVRLTAERKLS